MNRGSKNPAIVLGNSLTGLGIVRALHPMSVPVFVLDSLFQGSSGKTSWANKIDSPCVSSEPIIPFLKDLRPQFDETPVLFPTADATVQLLSRHREELGDYFFTLPEKQVVDVLLDKQLFAGYAADNNLRVPQTFWAENDDEMHRIIDCITYPCILKPNVRDKIYDEAGLRKGFKATCRNRLWGAYQRVKNYCPSVIVQQWIEGDDGKIHFCLMYSNSENRVVASVTGRKIRQYPPECGSTSLAECRRNDIVEEESRRIFDQIKFRGTGSIEYKLDANTEEYYIMEPTVGRVNLQSYLAVANGVNIPFLMYRECCGEDISRENVRPTYSVKWFHEYNDLASSYYYFRHNKLTLTEWFKSLSGKKAFALSSLRDPRPGVHLTAQVLKQCVRQLGKCLGLVGESGQRVSWKWKVVTPVLKACLPFVRSLPANNKRLRILTYHRVLDDGPEFMYDTGVVSCSPGEFERQVRYYKKHYNIINFSELQKFVESGGLPKNALIITFDDGYRDNYEYAYAVLKKYGVKATIFVTVRHVDNRELFWWDRVAYGLKRDQKSEQEVRDKIGQLKRLSNEDRAKKVETDFPADGNGQLDQMLTWAQINEMSEDGIEIGSHTMTHPTLSKLEKPEDLEFELSESKRILAERTHKEILAMSYPTGGPDSYNDQTIEYLKKSGYTFAATYIHGTNEINNNKREYYELRRIDADKRSLDEIKINLAYPGLFNQ